MDDLEDVSRVNVAGVHSITRAFLPLMRKGVRKRTVLNISTSLGSIAKQPVYKNSPVPLYKVTKAALNMLTVAFSRSWIRRDPPCSASIQVKWCRMDLGSRNADLPVETGVGAVLDVLGKTGREGNGRFFNVLVPG
ncbi:hypothetical protein BJX65DRAFT_277948 [Aspergillus insuetus]